MLGNLTRIESIRRALLHTYGPELLIDLLKHPQWDVVSAVTGILVNLSADVECKQVGTVELLFCCLCVLFVVVRLYVYL